MVERGWCDEESEWCIGERGGRSKTLGGVFYSVRRKEVNNEKTLLQDKKNKLGIIFIILWENKKRKKGFDCWEVPVVFLM